MILADQVEPAQLGAFLMLIRIREESPEELAGFVKAARNSLLLPPALPRVEVDWSSYAGKRRQLPWFILSALLLAENGITVLMHSTHGFKDKRIYTPDVIQSLGLPVCDDFQQAGDEIQQHNFAFISLENICPTLKNILNLRHLFGLRSPINTLLRMLNPMQAPFLMQGIFHPGYGSIHQHAALLLKQPHMAVFKGEGGETERNPDMPCQVLSVHSETANEQTWPAMFNGPRHLKDQTMDISRLAGLWQEEFEDEYATAAVTGTAAIALHLTGKADTIDAAEQLAKDMWQTRNRHRFNAKK